MSLIKAGGQTAPGRHQPLLNAVCGLFSWQFGSELTSRPPRLPFPSQELMPLVEHEFGTATDPAKVAFGGGSFAGGPAGQGAGGGRVLSVRVGDRCMLHLVLSLKR